MSERVLVFLLRAIALAAMLAVVPVFMPHEWMDAIHRRLGLGELPRLPVIVYLSRSLSAMYAFHGALLWWIARDVRRYAPLVTLTGALFVVFGAMLVWIDVHAGLPAWWIALEGPFAVVFGLAVLALQYGSRVNHKLATRTAEMADIRRPQCAK